MLDAMIQFATSVVDGLASFGVSFGVLAAVIAFILKALHADVVAWRKLRRSCRPKRHKKK